MLVKLTPVKQMDKNVQSDRPLWVNTDHIQDVNKDKYDCYCLTMAIGQPHFVLENGEEIMIKAALVKKELEL